MSMEAMGMQARNSGRPGAVARSNVGSKVGQMPGHEACSFGVVGSYPT